MSHSIPDPAAVVAPGSFLTLHYRLTGPQGDVINTFHGQPATLTLGASELAPAIEQRLLGLREGQQAAFELPAGAAFGHRHPDLLQWVSRNLLDNLGALGDGYETGEVLEFPAPGGQGRMAATVRQVEPDRVLLDFNHPLADQPVAFEVHLIGIL